jgi:acyl-CoA reductase-like NAD-dependent aldehyde dehydrogenase
VDLKTLPKTSYYKRRNIMQDIINKLKEQKKVLESIISKENLTPNLMVEQEKAKQMLDLVNKTLGELQC